MFGLFKSRKKNNSVRDIYWNTCTITYHYRRFYGLCGKERHSVEFFWWGAKEYQDENGHSFTKALVGEVDGLYECGYFDIKHTNHRCGISNSGRHIGSGGVSGTHCSIPNIERSF